MASQLARAHVEAQSKLRDVISTAVVRVWDAMPQHNDEDVNTFLDTALPIVEAGQRHAVSMLDGFWAAELEQKPTGLDPKDFGRDADPREVYRRPFTQLWHGFKQGQDWETASKPTLRSSPAAP